MVTEEVPGHLIEQGRVKEWNKWLDSATGSRPHKLHLDTVSGVHLNGLNLNGVHLIGATFERCHLLGVNMDSTRFELVDFKDCQLGGVDGFEVHGVNWDSVTVRTPPGIRSGPRITVIYSSINRSTFNGASSLITSDSTFDKCSFYEVKHMHFTHSTVNGCSIHGIDLSKVFQTGSRFSGTSLPGCVGSNTMMVAGCAGSGEMCYLIKEADSPRLVTGCREWESIEDCLDYLDGEVEEWRRYGLNRQRRFRENFLLWLAYAADSVGVELPGGGE